MLLSFKVDYGRVVTFVLASPSCLALVNTVRVCKRMTKDGSGAIVQRLGGTAVVTRASAGVALGDVVLRGLMSTSFVDLVFLEQEMQVRSTKSCAPVVTADAVMPPLVRLVHLCTWSYAVLCLLPVRRVWLMRGKLAVGLQYRFFFP